MATARATVALSPVATRMAQARTPRVLQFDESAGGVGDDENCQKTVNIRSKHRKRKSGHRRRWRWSLLSLLISLLALGHGCLGTPLETPAEPHATGSKFPRHLMSISAHSLRLAFVEQRAQRQSCRASTAHSALNLLIMLCHGWVKLFIS